jgi:hypothetical protein
MTMKRSFIGAAFSLAAAALFSTAAFASYELPLEGSMGFKDAKGTAIIEEGVGSIYEQEQITINVGGLKPNSVYTAWLAKDEPGERLQGLGVDPYSFRTDASGSGTFVATVGEGELNRWDVIEIAHHPNNDPSDLQNSQIALRGDLGGIFD